MVLSSQTWQRGDVSSLMFKTADRVRWIQGHHPESVLRLRTRREIDHLC